MTDKPNNASSIQWIRDEIEKNTESAITALEGYFDHDDSAYIVSAQKSLHEIYGTLQIVELYPPSTLASEIEKTLGYIVDHSVRLDSDAISEIIKSITLIVRYIDSELSGAQTLRADHLLDPLNILRAIRNEKTVASLKPSNTHDFKDQQIRDDDDYQGKNRPTLAVKLLKLFQFSYLKFVQGEEPVANLAYMTQSVQRFSKLFPQKNLTPLWNALSGALESLMLDEQFNHVANLKEYLGKITHLLKIFSSPKSTQITGKILSSVFSQTLKILQQMSAKTPLAEQVLAHHSAEIDDENDGNQLLSPKALSQNTLTALGAALAEEIGYVKDALDVFSRSNATESADLNHLYHKIKQLSDSMILIEELEIPRQALDQQILLLDQMITTSTAPEESWLVELATALLFVESSAERITDAHKTVQSLQFDKHDIFLDAQNSVLRETLVDLAKVKSLYVDSISSMWDQNNLKQMQSLLFDTEARLLYIDERRAIDLIQEISKYIQFDLFQRSAPPEWPEIEKFADIIAAVDQYLYLKIDNKGLTTKLLEHAKTQLAELYSPTDEALASMPEEAVSLAEPPTLIVQAKEDAAPPSIDPESESEEEDDSEIREIFLEELAEINEELNGLLHTISANLDDTQCLVEIRRLIHTVKGSGRMAKVMLISEPALALEKLLNELLDTNTSPSPSLLNLMTDFIKNSSNIAAEISPETQQASTNFVKVFTDKLNELHGESPAAEPELDTPEPLQTDTTKDSDSLFSELQKQEIQTHFDKLFHYFQANSDFIQQAPQDSNMLRAAHTLKAIFKGAKHDRLTQEYERFETLLRAALQDNQQRSTEFFETLEKACEVIGASIKSLSALNEALPEFSTSLNSFAALLEQKGSHHNPYETWLERNYDIFDRLIQNQASAIEPDSYQEHISTLKKAAQSAAELELVHLEHLILIHTKCLSLVFSQPQENRGSSIAHIAKMQESLLNIADRIAMGQGRIELEPIERFFQAQLDEVEDILAASAPKDSEAPILDGNLDETESDTAKHVGPPTLEPIDESPVDESPVDESPIDESPVDESPVDETPIDETPIDETPIDETPIDETPLDESPAQELPVGELLEDEDEDIALIFKEELSEILESIDIQLKRFLDRKATVTTLQELQRDYHTIKGGAEYIEEKFLASLAKEADLICERFLDTRKLPPESVISTLLLTQHLFKDRLARLPNIKELNDEERRIIEDLRATKPLSDRLVEQSTATAENAKTSETSAQASSTSANSAFAKDVSDIVIDENNQDIIEIFLEEAHELLHDLGGIIKSLEEPTASDQSHLAQNTLRLVHTLKGGARLSGIESIGSFAHYLEAKIEKDNSQNIAAFLPELKQFSGCVIQTLEHIQNLIGGTAVAPLATTTPAPAPVPKPQAPLAAAPDPDPVEEPELQNVAPLEQSLTIAPAQTDPSHESSTTNPIALSPETATGNDSLADYDQEILEIFYEESHELVEELEKTVGQITDNQITEDTMDQLKRILHTLKGSARLAGFPAFGNQAHVFESHLETLRTPTNADQTTEVIALNDSLFATLQTILKSIEQRLEQTAAPADKPTTDRVHATDETIKVEPYAKPRVAKRKKNTEVVRVGADLLEKLVNLAGETMISRSSVQQELLGFTRIIDEFGITLDRIRDQIRSFENETESRMLSQQAGKIAAPSLPSDTEVYGEFDTLEMDRFSAFHQLARSLSESASDLMDMRDTMLDKVRTTESLVLQQSRIQTELHEGLMQSRMVPFSRLAPRLTRMVRQIADELGKKAELTIVNAEGEMDRSVLERMIPPLEHMLRNALDHGIETPDRRLEQKKNPVGQITLHLFREGNEIVLRLSDDGAGIDVRKVREKAINQGMLAADSQLTEKEILQFIFKPGFSTASTVTQISGRGVGMDVVFSEIKQLNGTLKLHAAPNAGTEFTIRLPFTVSMSRALMVKVGDEDFAIPLTHIEGVVRVSPYELNSIYENKNSTFSYAEKKYEVRYLGQYLNGKNRNSEIKESVPLILARNTERSIAVQVDQLIGSREVVVKNTGAQLSQVIGLSGATILPDGSVVIILDLNALIRDTFASGTVADEIPTPAAPIAPRESSNPLIMVVDDSVTVRKVTSRLLERHGMEVITAKDGIDAVTQLREVTPNLILLDIEMPRMDGFEVASHIRHDPRLADTPIIMISSRTGDKHRSRAAALGVNEFLGKPYQELQLLEYINDLVVKL